MDEDTADIAVCQNQNLIYVRTLKCASSFFYFNFVKNSNWRKIHWNDIDWNRHHVFGHLLEPLTRRHRAIAERLCMFGLEQLYFDTPVLQRCLRDSITLDQHGEMYSNRYGNYANKIDWIPLIGDHGTAIKMTEICIRHYLPFLPDIQWDFAYSNTSPALQKKLELHLANMWDVGLFRNKLLGWKKRQLDCDIDLYKQVVEKFNPSATTWPEASWLRSL